MVETQETLTERFNALQDSILTLIEEGPKDLKSQIKFWELTRKEHVTLYYARKSGYNRLGLQPIPTPAVSEYNAKQAIHMQLLLSSLNKSRFANEEWTLADCSAELINTVPKDCFKKLGYTVEVWYDNEKSKAFPYTNWRAIYYQDSNDVWQKVEGKVDENGLYFNEVNGDQVYFVLFGADAEKYGVTGQWTVHYSNTTIVSSSSFVRRPAESSEKSYAEPSTSRDSQTPSPKRRRPAQEAITSSTSAQPTSSLRDRGRGEGERTTSVSKRRRRTSVDSPERSVVPTASQVGSGHRLPPRSGLGRLQRLQAEAWDPPILILKGPANNLKCWRNKIKGRQLFSNCSNVWRWLGHGCTQSRMLLAFESESQRQHFLKLVKLPKHTTFAYGNLESL